MPPVSRSHTAMFFVPTPRRSQMILAALLFAAAPAQAQVMCNQKTRMPSQPPTVLQLFSGTYTVKSVSSADSIGVEGLDYLEGITIPENIGVHQQFMLRAPDVINHGNLNWKFAPRISVWWGKPDHPGPDFSFDEKDYMAASHSGWCIASGLTSGGRTVTIRAAWQRDGRWKTNVGNAADWLGGVIGVREDYKYVGVRVIPTMLDGAGFPVQKYVVENRQAAINKANALYNDERDAEMHFSTYETLLGARIQRREWKEKRCELTRTGAVWQRQETCSMVTMVGYHRTLSGEIRRRAYQDARVGIPGHTEAGMEWRLAVAFENMVAGTAEEMAGYALKVTMFCGTPRGCGRGVMPDARGLIMHAGSDDSLRLAQLCKAIRKEDCDRGSAIVRQLDAIEADDQVRITRDSIAFGERPVVAEAEKAVIRAGTRTSEGGTVATQSQTERFCFGFAQEDSAQRANGFQPATATSAHRQTVYQHCMTEVSAGRTPTHTVEDPGAIPLQESLGEDGRGETRTSPAGAPSTRSGRSPLPAKGRTSPSQTRPTGGAPALPTPRPSTTSQWYSPDEP